MLGLWKHVMVPVGKIHHILCQIFARKGRIPELCISYAALSAGFAWQGQCEVLFHLDFTKA